jgi:hypothetical protein
MGRKQRKFTFVVTLKPIYVTATDEKAALAAAESRIFDISNDGDERDMIRTVTKCKELWV